MSDNPSRSETYMPREEARHFEDIAKLTDAQQRALERIERYLSNMAINSTKNSPQRSPGVSHTPAIPRYNNTLLLSGDRGTGKTTVLATLQWRLDNGITPVLSEHSVSIENIPHRSGRRNSIKHLTPTIDLQPGTPFGSLAVTLTIPLLRQIEELERLQHLGKHCSGAQSRLSSRSHWNRFVSNASIISKDIANSGIDSHQLSQIVASQAQGFTFLANSFRSLCDALVSDYKDYHSNTHPLFTIMIDDADMHPQRSLELSNLCEHSATTTYPT